MPPLVVHGRKYLVASDDVSPALGTGILLRAFWLALLLYTCACVASGIERCGDAWLVWLYAGLSMANYVIAIIIQALAIHASLQGTLVEPEKRAFVAKAFIALALLGVGELVIAVFGLTLVVGKSPVCTAALAEALSHDRNGVQPTTLVLVSAVTQIVDLAVFSFCAHALKGRREPQLSDPNPGNLNMLEREMEERCRFAIRLGACFTCGLFGSARDGDFRMAGRVLAALFSSTSDDHALDLTPSDVVAGLILLRHEHRAQDAEQARTSPMEAAAPLEPAVGRAGRLSPPSFSLRRGRGGISLPMTPAAEASTTPLEERLLANHNRAYRVAGKDLLRRSDEAAVADLDDLGHYHPYFLAPYTWMYLIYSSPFTGWFRILCTLLSLPRAATPRDPNFAPSATMSSRLQPQRLKARLSSSLTDEDEVADADIELGGVGVGGGGGEPRFGLRQRSGYQSVSTSEQPLLWTEGAMGVVEGDNWARLHTAAFVSIGGIRPDELIYASFRNGLGQIPYAIVKDTQRGQIVISVRGSLSLEDVMVDVAGEPRSLEELGEACGFDGRGCWAHGGIVQVAEWVWKDLDRHGLLDATMGQLAGWGLTLVGHSLGGGVASLLGFMLRQRYPRLRVIAYSPPGGAMNQRMASAMEPFCITLILGDDLFPRMGPGSMIRLRNDILDVISRAKVNKASIMRSVLDTTTDPEELANNMLYPPGGAPATVFRRHLTEYQAYVRTLGEDRIASGVGEDDVAVPPGTPSGHQEVIAKFASAGRFGVPGRVIHLVKTKDEAALRCLSVTCKADRSYTPVYASPDDFRRMRISPSMGIDHFPDRIAPALEGVMADWGLSAD